MKRSLKETLIRVIILFIDLTIGCVILAYGMTIVIQSDAGFFLPLNKKWIDKVSQL